MQKIGFYKVIDALTKELRKSGFSYVTFGNYTDIDLDKQSTYPYAHIVIPDGHMDQKVTSFRIPIIVADLVDEQKEYSNTTDAQGDVDNVVDVLQDTLAKVEEVVKKLEGLWEFEMIYTHTFYGFKEQFTNLLAGWTFYMQVEVRNLADDIC